MFDLGLYREEYTVEGDYVDYKREIRLSSLLRLFQETATHHLSNLGVSEGYLRSLSLHWVVVRYHIEVKRMPIYEEKITVETHAAPKRAYLFPRYFNVYDEEGDLIVRAASVWVLAHDISRKIALPDEISLKEFGKLTGDEIPFDLSLHLEKKGEKHLVSAPYSRCDINRHLNNCAYFDVLLDEIDADFYSSHSIKEVDIQYKKELFLGQEAEVYVYSSSSRYDFYSDYFFASIAFGD